MSVTNKFEKCNGGFAFSMFMIQFYKSYVHMRTLKTIKLCPSIRDKKYEQTYEQEQTKSLKSSLNQIRKLAGARNWPYFDSRQYFTWNVNRNIWNSKLATRITRTEMTLLSILFNDSTTILHDAKLLWSIHLLQNCESTGARKPLLLDASAIPQRLETYSKTSSINNVRQSCFEGS